jgi:hypothetical protein
VDGREILESVVTPVGQELADTPGFLESAVGRVILGSVGTLATLGSVGTPGSVDILAGLG